MQYLHPPGLVMGGWNDSVSKQELSYTSDERQESISSWLEKGGDVRILEDN